MHIYLTPSALSTIPQTKCETSVCGRLDAASIAPSHAALAVDRVLAQKIITVPLDRCTRQKSPCDWFHSTN